MSSKKRSKRAKNRRQDQNDFPKVAENLNLVGVGVILLFLLWTIAMVILQAWHGLHGNLGR
jgi:hypothetical protein